MKEFKKGDRLECVDDSHRSRLKNGEVYIYDKVSTSDPDACCYIEGDTAGYFSKRFKLADQPFKPEYFSALNASEAEKYIGQEMEFADGDSLDRWKEGILEVCRTNILHPFTSSVESERFHFTRTIQPKPKKDNSKLLRALKLSEKQWQIMTDNPSLSKKEVYRLLGGKSEDFYCFLCDSFNAGKCDGCINWTDNYEIGDPCVNLGSPYFKFRSNDTQETRLGVLNHIQAAIAKLEPLTKGDKLDEICGACGESYGRHKGAACPDFVGTDFIKTGTYKK